MTGTRRNRYALVLLLIAIRVGAIVWGLHQLPSDRAGRGLGNDAGRFHQIVSSPGTPYRSFQVEVAPVELLTIRALDAGSGRGLADRLVWFSLACDLAAAWILWVAWDPRIAIDYLLLGVPLSLFIYFRLDLLSVAAAVGAAALARTRHQVVSGFTLAVGALAKLWPAVLVPLLWFGGRRRAAVVAAAAVAAGGAAWVLWGGWDGPVQVATFRHSAGWEVESPIGFLVWQIGGDRLQHVAGSDRVGSIPPSIRAALLVCSLAVGLLASWRSRDDPGQTGSFAAVAAVAGLLVFSPLVSHQFVAWLLPWVAISRERALRVFTLVGGVAASGVIAANSIGGVVATASSLYLLTLRNVSIVAILVVAIVRLFRPGTRETLEPTGAHQDAQSL